MTRIPGDVAQWVEHMSRWTAPWVKSPGLKKIEQEEGQSEFSYLLPNFSNFCFFVFRTVFSIINFISISCIYFHSIKIYVLYRLYIHSFICIYIVYVYCILYLNTPYFCALCFLLPQEIVTLELKEFKVCSIMFQLKCSSN